MNIKQILEELMKLNEMAPYLTKKPFPQFYKDTLYRYNYKKERQQAKKQNKDIDKLYPPLPYENNCIGKLVKDVVITNSCIEHVYKRHANMTPTMWNKFLRCFNPKEDKKIKTKYNGQNGKRWVYSCNNQQNYFGYVVDVFTSSNPQIVTVFTDQKNNIENWIQNAVNAQPEEYENDMD